MKYPLPPHRSQVVCSGAICRRYPSGYEISGIFFFFLTQEKKEVENYFPNNLNLFVPPKDLVEQDQDLSPFFFY